MAAVARDSSGCLIVAGGFDHGDRFSALQTAERYDPEANVWSELPAMRIARCCCSGALDKRSRMYVVGGGETMYRSSRAWNTVEWLDSVPSSMDAWRPGPPMGETRCGPGVAYSSFTDHLLAVGGYGGLGRYLDSAERLDLAASGEGRWDPLPPMSCQRAGPNAAVGPDHRLYVLGGGPDGVTAHDTMEMLDLRDRRWQRAKTTLRVGRHYNAAAFGPDGRLYVAGTFRHTGQLDVVERYDPRMDMWEDLPDMCSPVQFSAGTFLF